jgi:hypothetical protein
MLNSDQNKALDIINQLNRDNAEMLAGNMKLEEKYGT